MIRLINSQRSTYHHTAITEFSDISSLIVTGVAKGYASNKYSWVSDFLSKHSGNLSINPHIGHVAFYSERDIFQQSYGNIERLHNHYPFLSDYNFSIFPKYYEELSTKQYFKVGQKFSEYDIVQYVNISELYTLTLRSLDPDYHWNRVNFNIKHEYYRAPAFYTSGYKVDMEYEEEPGYKYFDRYMWALPKSISPNRSVYKDYIVNEHGFDITLLPMFADYFGDSDIPDIIDPYTQPNLVKRLFDYKVLVDNPEYHYFHNDTNNWIINHKNLNAGSNKYYPYINFVQCFLEDWSFITPYYEYYSATPPWPPPTPVPGYIRFYPEITQNGVLEPGKTIVDWGNSRSGGQPITRMGVCAINPGNHLGHPDDQSRIVYNICKHMTQWDGTRFVIHKEDFAENDVLIGLDLDTERNRRNSAVVMTEPYFTVKPIANGQVAQISFVDYKRDSIQHESVDGFLTDPSMYLKIKAPLTFIKELDRYLVLEEVNTDIIDTLIIKNPRDNYGMFNSDPAFLYDNFGEDNETLLYRQEFCLDDLVEGRVGTGQHRKFYISAIGPRADKYSDDEMKVSGMGFVCKTIINQAGEIQSGHNEYLHIYCNNHWFTNTPAHATVTPPLPNVDIEILTDTSIVTRIQQYEKFRPMIKLPGVNGYVKILGRNPHFKIQRVHDGEYEVIYNVEFPFCPGSAYERFAMNYNDEHPYLPSQVFYKADYINAGSWEMSEVDSDERYDSTNNRHAPYGDDSFTRHELFRQVAVSDAFNDIGGFIHYYYDYTSTLENIDKSEYHSEVIKYPTHLIWEQLDWNFLSLIKSQIEEFKRYGTYDVSVTQTRVEFDIEQYLPYFTSDLKLIALADNRQWNFDKDKYISFIGRENPAYVCEMDISTLFEDFQSFQIKNGAIPDVKRWLYGYFSGFAHMIATSTESETRDERATPGLDTSLTTQDAQSNIIIEVWDSASDIGNDKLGNWRPLSLISSDTEKVAGELILDKLFIFDDSETPSAPITNEFEDVWSFYLGYADIDSFPYYPPEFDPTITTEPSKFDLINEQSNLVLSDFYGLKNYHIIYTKWAGQIDGVSAFKVWVRYDETQSDLFVKDYTLIDVTNIPTTWGVLSIHKPEKYLSKNSNFVLKTNKPSPESLIESVTRYIDIKSQEGTGGIPDFDRYLSNENKIFFRIRVRKNNDYPVNYIDEDTSDIQYLGSGIETGDDWVNFPWEDSGVFDAAFDWGKITTLERVRRLGLTYFKCASQ